MTQSHVLTLVIIYLEIKRKKKREKRGKKQRHGQVKSMRMNMSPIKSGEKVEDLFPSKRDKRPSSG